MGKSVEIKAASCEGEVRYVVIKKFVGSDRPEFRFAATITISIVRDSSFRSGTKGSRWTKGIDSLSLPEYSPSAYPSFRQFFGAGNRLTSRKNQVSFAARRRGLPPVALP